MAEDGVGVGRWKTFVRGLRIHTFGLGGDSAVRARDGSPFLDSRRAVPLCIACEEHPELRAQLEALAEEHPDGHTLPLHEGFLPGRDITRSSYTEREKRFCALFRKEGPMLLGAAAKAIGTDPYSMDVSRLVREEAVRVCGFTPTDAMHLRGDFTRYDATASRIGARFMAAGVKLSEEQLLDRVYDEIKKKLYVNVIRALLGIDILRATST
jgi:N-methylhydantoinase A/oxoprolinase/acetone carboxylase beta subunit